MTRLEAVIGAVPVVAQAGDTGVRRRIRADIQACHQGSGAGTLGFTDADADVSSNSKRR
jgi:hypothetical protein